MTKRIACLLISIIFLVTMIMPALVVSGDSNTAVDLVLWGFESTNSLTYPQLHSESGGTNTSSQALDSENKTESDNSVRVTAGGSYDWLMYWVMGLNALDITPYKYIAFDLYVEDASKVLDVRTRYGNAGGIDGAEYICTDALTNGWNTVYMPVADFVKQVDSCYDPAAVTQFRISVHMANGGGDYVANFDNLRLTNERVYTDKVVWGFESTNSLTYPQLHSESGGTNTSSQSLDSENKTESDNSVKVTAGGSYDWLMYWVMGLNALDITPYKYIAFDLYVEDASKVLDVRTRYGNAGGIDGAEYICTDALTNGWNTVYMPVADFVKQVDSCYDPAAVTQFRISVHMANGGGDYVANFDNLRLTNERVYADAVLWNFDSISDTIYPQGLNVSGGADYNVSQALDSEDKTEGSASTAVTASGNYHWILYWLNGLSTAGASSVDLTPYKYLALDMYVTDVSKVSTVKMSFGPSSVDDAEYVYTGGLTSGWNTIYMPVADFTIRGGANTLTEAQNFRLALEIANGGDFSYKLDNLRLTNERVYADAVLWNFDSTSETIKPEGLDLSSGSGFTVTPSLDSADKTEGDASTLVTASGEYDWILYWLPGLSANGASTVDLTPYKYLALDMYVTDVPKVSTVQMRFGKTGVDGAEYIYNGGLTSGWNTIYMPVADFTNVGADYTLTEASQFRFSLEIADGGDFSYKLDNLRLTNEITEIENPGNDDEEEPVIPAQPQMIWDFDATIDACHPQAHSESGASNSTAQTLDIGNLTEGTASASVTASGSYEWLMYWVGGLTATDITPYTYIAFDLYVKDASKVSDVRMRYGNTGGVDGAEYIYTGALANGWNRVYMPIADFVEQVAALNTPKAVTVFRITLHVPDGGDLAFKLDNLHLTNEKQAASQSLWNFDTISGTIYPQTHSATGGVGSAVQELDAVGKTEGTASTLVNASGDYGWLLHWLNGLSTPNSSSVDLTPYKYIAFDLWLKDVSKVENVIMRFGAPGVDGAEYTYTAALKNGWNTIYMPVDDFTNVGEANYTLTEASVFRITLTMKTSGVFAYKMDDLRLTNMMVISDFADVPDGNTGNEDPGTGGDDGDDDGDDDDSGNDPDVVDPAKLLWGFDQILETAHPDAHHEKNGNCRDCTSQKLDSTDMVEGTASAVVTVAETGDYDWLMYWVAGQPATDITPYEYIAFDLWVEDASKVDYLLMRYGNVNGIDGAEDRYDGALSDGWNTIYMPLADFVKASDNCYSPTKTTCYRISLKMNTDGAYSFKLDNLQLTDEIVIRPHTIWDFDTIEKNTIYPQTHSESGGSGTATQKKTIRNKTEGDASTLVTIGGNYDWLLYWVTGMSKLDITPYTYMAFDLYVEDASKVDYILMRYGNASGVDGAEYKYTGELTDGWNTVCMPLADFVKQVDGCYEPTAVSQYRISLKMKDAGDFACTLDNLRVTAELPDAPVADTTVEPETVWSFDTMDHTASESRIDSGVAGGSTTQVLDNNKTEGTSSAAISVMGSYDWLLYTVKDLEPVDITEYGYIAVDVWLDDASLVDSIVLSYGNANGIDGAEYKYTGALQSGWNTIYMPIAEFVEKNASMNTPEAVTQFRISLEMNEDLVYSYKLDNLQLTNDRKNPSKVIWDFDSGTITAFPQSHSESGGSGTAMQELDPVNRTQGEYSTAVRMVGDFDWLLYWISGFDPVDTTYYEYIALDVYVEDASRVSQVQLTYGNGQGIDGAIYTYGGALTNGWNTVYFPLDSFVKRVEAYYSPDAVTRFRVSLKVIGDGLFTCTLDNLRFSPLPYGTVLEGEEEDYIEPEIETLLVSADKSVNVMNGVIMLKDKITLSQLLASLNVPEGCTIAVYDGKAAVSGDDTVIESGMVLKVLQGSEVMETYNLRYYGSGSLEDATDGEVDPDDKNDSTAGGDSSTDGEDSETNTSVNTGVKTFVWIFAIVALCSLAVLVTTMKINKART